MTCYNFCHPGNIAGSVYISGTTCGYGIGAFYLTSGQCICLDVDESYITCDSPVLSGSCAPPTPTPTTTSTQTPSVTPTQTSTATPTQTTTQTQTPSQTSTATPTQTSTQTPSVTPSQTATNTQTPSVTPTNTQTPSVTPTKTATNTPTPSITPTSTPNCANCVDSIFYTATTSGILTFNLCNPAPGVNNPKTVSISAGQGQLTGYGCSGTQNQGIDINGISFSTTGFTYTLASNCCPPTPTPTPTQTASPTRTPSQTPSQTATRTMTPTPSITPTQTSDCANCVDGFVLSAATSPFQLFWKRCGGTTKLITNATSPYTAVGECNPLLGGVDINSISASTAFVIQSVSFNCCPATPTPTATPTQTSTPSQTATQTNTPSQTATPTQTPSTTPPNYVCYYFQNEDSVSSSIFYYSVYAGSTSEVLPAGDAVQRCVDPNQFAPYYTGGVTTIGPCSSATSCMDDGTCEGCT